ncbi:MAG: cupin domain-containing protein [Actinobacteria bacterium]|nr:cupin domain-containing protein [Actinomycetota bacterium]
MPAARVDELEIAAQMDGYEARGASWGDMTVSFETMGAADPAPLFEGLPDNRCQAAHYGFVFEGELVVRYADSEETITAGQAYYLPPGHVPLVRTSARTMEFTRNDELAVTQEVIGKNLANGVEVIRL